MCKLKINFYFLQQTTAIFVYLGHQSQDLRIQSHILVSTGSIKTIFAWILKNKRELLSLRSKSCDWEQHENCVQIIMYTVV